MQDNRLGNIKNMYEYREWNNEMIALYRKYNMVSELNQELMRELPVYAMYTISEYLKRKIYEVEDSLKEYADERYKAAGKDPDLFALAIADVDAHNYEVLKPYVQDKMLARMYFSVAVNRSHDEYVEYLASREEQEVKKTK